MRAQTVDVKSSNGRVLCCTVFRPGGKKLLAKGHIISDDDIRVLESEGMASIWVTELEEGEVGEDDAVCAVASEMGCGSFEIRLAAGGRANLQATEKCCVLVDDDLLKQINCAASVVIATALNFSFAMPGSAHCYREKRAICRFPHSVGCRGQCAEGARSDLAGAAHAEPHRGRFVHRSAEWGSRPAVV
jgi:hypothetical protein